MNLAELVAARPELKLWPGWMLGCGMEGAALLPRWRRRIWSRARRPFELRWLEGIRITVSTPDEIIKSLYLTGLFEPNEFLWLRDLLKPDMTFVDVGANVGLYTLYAARKVGPNGVVVSIEPSSREFQKLRASVELNRFTNVRLRNVGVSDHAGEAELLVADEIYAGHNSLGGFGHGTALASRERVRLTRLDDLLQEEGLHRLDVLKMDIEGAELFALRGARETLRRFRPILLIEVSDRTLNLQNCSSGQVLDFLADAGYNFQEFDPATGLPIPMARRPNLDGVNIIATPSAIAEPVFSGPRGLNNADFPARNNDGDR